MESGVLCMIDDGACKAFIGQGRLPLLYLIVFGLQFFGFSAFRGNRHKTNIGVEQYIKGSIFRRRYVVQAGSSKTRTIWASSFSALIEEVLENEICQGCSWCQYEKRKLTFFAKKTNWSTCVLNVFLSATLKHNYGRKNKRKGHYCYVFCVVMNNTAAKARFLPLLQSGRISDFSGNNQFP